MQLISIQISRVFAAWLVVFHHYMQRFYNFKATSFLGLIFVAKGEFGVDIFFVISGFIMFYTLSIKHYSSLTFFLLKSLFFIPHNNPTGIGIYPLLPVG